MQSDSIPIRRAEFSSAILVGSKIQKAISDYNLIEEGDKILVGLSGGADSMMLTHYLKFCLKLQVCACHVNHNLRGEESIRDMDFVKKTCKEWEIPLAVHDVDVTNYAVKNKLTIEQAGRQLRYEFFEEDRAFFGAQKIATAHSLSDNAETLVFNLVRGTGLKGLCGIPPKRDNIIRPIINLIREEIENYLAEFNVTYVNDSTNFDNIYTRNKIRHEVLPKLVTVNPQFFPAVNRTIQTLNCEQNFLQEQTEECYDSCEKSDGLSISRLLTYHEAIIKRTIAMFLEKNDILRSNDLINKLYLIVFNDNGKINVTGNIFIKAYHHILQIEINEEELAPFEFPLELGDVVLPDGEAVKIFTANDAEIKQLKKVYKKSLYVIMDYGKIEGQPVLRNRKSGDKINIAGRSGTKSLKKLFIDEKLSNIAKSKQLVIADMEDNVIGVLGFGEDVTVCPDEKTEIFLAILKRE